MKKLKYILLVAFLFFFLVAGIIIMAKIVSYFTTETVVIEAQETVLQPVCPYSVNELCSPIEEQLTTSAEQKSKGKLLYSKPVVHHSVETEETIETTTITEEENNEPYYNVSPYNRTALIHLLYFEACGGSTEEDIKEQRAIISVVFNRLYSKKYDHCHDASDIIFYQYPSGAFAFSPADNEERFWEFIIRDKDGNIDEVRSKRLKEDFNRNYNQLAEKVDYVIQHGSTVPENVLYFVSNKCFEQSSYFKNNHKVYAVYDDTTFMTNEMP